MNDLQQDDAVAPTAAATRPHPAGAGHAGSLAFVTALSLVAAVGGFLFGFDSGVINGAVDALAEAFGTRAAGTGFAVASVLLGCAVGAFVAGTLADFMGRHPTMLLNATLFLISAAITGAAGSAGVFIAGRLLGGLAIGAASVLAPMYISEVAPARPAVHYPARRYGADSKCSRARRAGRHELLMHGPCDRVGLVAGSRRVSGGCGGTVLGASH